MIKKDTIVKNIFIPNNISANKNFEYIPIKDDENGIKDIQAK